jgi:hypothetical protein
MPQQLLISNLKLIVTPTEIFVRLLSHETTNGRKNVDMGAATKRKDAKATL